MTAADGRPGRRRFLGLLAAGGATVVAAGAGWRIIGQTDDDQDDRAEAVPANVRPSADVATAAIGRRYLEVAPNEATEDALRAQLPVALRQVRPGEQPGAVATAVRAEFERDETVELDGWLLSLTECRLAALAVV